MSDHPTSDCSEARELISIDADHQLYDRSELVAHLAECAACRQYEAGVASLTRRTRVRAATHDPAFVARVMNASAPARLGRGSWLRPALLWCAVLSGYHSIEPLFFGNVEGASTHVARHVGATSLALAIGFLIVAIKPYRAAGLLPFVAALGATTLIAAVLDVMSGVTAGRSELLVHFSEVTGMVLLWMIAGSPGVSRLTRLRPAAAR